MVCAEKPRLLVLVADRTEVSADDLEVGILANVVLGHLKHAEMEVGDGAEGAACYQDERLLLWVPEDAREAVCREGIVWGICEVGCPRRR